MRREEKKKTESIRKAVDNMREKEGGIFGLLGGKTGVEATKTEEDLAPEGEADRE